MGNKNTTCGCSNSYGNFENYFGKDMEKCSLAPVQESTCSMKNQPTCSCEKPLENNENCTICVDEGSIFLPDLESQVSNFVLKDVWTEFTINGTVAVPIQKPSIEQVDGVNAKVQIISKKVIETPAVYGTPPTVTSTVKNEEGKITTGRKLVIEGLICTSVSYVSLNRDQSVHSYHGQVPFSAFIVLPKDADLDANYEVYALVEEICVKQVCDRNVSFTFAILLTAEKTAITDCIKSYYANSGIDCNGYKGQCNHGECFTDQPVIKGVCSPVQIENLITKNTETLWTEISVPELLTIPSCKPEVLQILTVTSSVEVMCQDVINTPTAVANYENLELTGLKLLVHAVLRQRITYISNKDCRSVHSAHFDVPVSAYIVLPTGTSPLSKYKIRTCIEDLYACALNGRQIFKNTTLFIKAEPIVCS